MRTGKDVWCVPIPLSIIKRIEGVFISELGMRIWTQQGEDHTVTRNYYIAKERTGSRRLIHFEDLWGYIQNKALIKAISDELEPELSTLKTTLWDWLNDNKVRRSEIVERT